MERGKKMARKFRVVVNGKEYIVEVEELGQSTVAQVVQEVVQPKVVSQTTTSQNQVVEKQLEKPVVSQQVQSSKPQTSSAVSKTAHEVKSPMAGIILKVTVSEGQKVSRGQKLAVLEAMKMENDIVSEYEGVVAKILVKEGDTVETQQTLMIIE